MACINTGYLSGRVYGEAEGGSLRVSTFNDTKVVSFAIRQYRRLRDGSDKVDFIPLEAWGPLAEALERVYERGMFAVVSYSIRVKKDRNNHTQVVLRVESFDRQPAPRDGQQAAPAEEPVAEEVDADFAGDGEDIPF